MEKLTELDRAYKQIEYLAQTLEVVVKENDRLRSRLDIARDALEEIVIQGDCESRMLAREAMDKIAKMESEKERRE